MSAYFLKKNYKGRNEVLLFVSFLVSKKTGVVVLAMGNLFLKTKYSQEKNNYFARTKVKKTSGKKNF